MDAEKLKEVLRRHALWLRGETGGERANLYEANLYEANLSGADLYEANLSGADLRGANLRWADLCEANMYEANMYGANLYEANLSGADLYEANLSGADLRGANLRWADLCGADLSGANLYKANLRGADLYGADLYGADMYGAKLYGANLYGANLSRAKLVMAKLCGAKNISPLVAARMSIVPQTGAYEAWKQCKDGALVHLLIPADSRRSNATGRKCRAEFVEVLAVYSKDGAPAEAGIAIYDNKTEYRVGQRVHCHEWCEDRWQECAGGIHHYLTREEAAAKGE